MKFRMLLIAAAMLAFATLSFGQLTVTLSNLGADHLLTEFCPPDNHSMPYNTMIKIWWDEDSNGPTSNDRQPPVDETGETPNTFNMDQFQYGVNNEGYEMGEFYVSDPGAFISNAYQFPTGVFRFYLTCETAHAVWTSAVVTFQYTPMPQEAVFAVWTCVAKQTCGQTPTVILTPNVFSYPYIQNNVHACAEIGTGVTQIIVPVLYDRYLPHISIGQGCGQASACNDNFDCEPITGFTMSPWTLGPLVPPVGGFVMAYYANLQASGGCCGCITLDYVEPVSNIDAVASASDNSVTLTWSVAAQSGVTKWEVYRNEVKLADVNADVYTYTDVRATNGTTYSYKVVGIGADAQMTSNVVEATPMANLAVITKYDVSQNYPNPFNPSTTISFDVLKSNHVSMKVFNAMGQEVTTLANGTYEGGKRYTVNFDAKSLTSGLYFYTIKIGNDFSATKKMLLVK